MSDSWQPHGLQHSQLPRPSLSCGVCLNSSSLSWWCYLTISSSATPFSFAKIRIFSNKSVLRIRWPKYWSFSISPSNEYSGLISFRIDWFDLHAVQWTLKSLLQHHSSKASILQCPAFFMVQLSHPYLTTGKNSILNLIYLNPQNNSLRQWLLLLCNRLGN